MVTKLTKQKRVPFEPELAKDNHYRLFSSICKLLRCLHRDVAIPKIYNINDVDKLLKNLRNKAQPHIWILHSEDTRASHFI